MMLQEAGTPLLLLPFSVLLQCASCMPGHCTLPSQSKQRPKVCQGAGLHHCRQLVPASLHLQPPQLVVEAFPVGLVEHACIVQDIVLGRSLLL